MLKLIDNTITKRYHVIKFYAYPFVDNILCLIHDRESDTFYNCNEQITADNYYRLIDSLKESHQILKEYDCDIL